MSNRNREQSCVIFMAALTVTADHDISDALTAAHAEQGTGNPHPSMTREPAPRAVSPASLHVRVTEALAASTARACAHG